MSIVVEQTLPYTSSELQLEDPARWSRLFPLMRPSIKSVEIGNGQTVVLDTALANNKNVLIAAIGSLGNFSSKILSESHVAAFTSEPLARGTITAEDIVKVLTDSGFPTENGLVVMRGGSEQDLKVGSGVVEVSVIGELKFDHILSLLASVKPEVK
jgi:dihydroxyacetone kinase